MLSYRKSQQVLLAEKLKKKNVIHVLGVSGSGTTMARLCLSAFARVATQAALQLKHCIFFATAHSCGLRRSLNRLSPIFATFATAHSCGLRPAFGQHVVCNRVFATAHSCGLRLCVTDLPATRRTLPQRIRAGCDEFEQLASLTILPLPQRIRAGCDPVIIALYNDVLICHSAFVRVATPSSTTVPQGYFFATAHSCGLRLAKTACTVPASTFATAHSCGLRRLESKPSFRFDGFATAHSCGLRPCCFGYILKHAAFATAHSCGLRRRSGLSRLRQHRFATAHSCGLRLRKSNAAHCEFAARR